jgi:hypothetical protein
MSIHDVRKNEVCSYDAHKVVEEIIILDDPAKAFVLGDSRISILSNKACKFLRWGYSDKLRPK